MTSIAIYSVILGGIVRLLRMGKEPLSVDWDVVKGLYLQGVPTTTLSERFGINANTLRSKASNKGWNAIV